MLDPTWQVVVIVMVVNVEVLLSVEVSVNLSCNFSILQSAQSSRGRRGHRRGGSFVRRRVDSMNRGRHNGRACWKLQTMGIEGRSVESSCHWFPLLIILLSEYVLIFPSLLFVSRAYDPVSWI